MWNWIKSDLTFKILGYALVTGHLLVDGYSFFLMFVVYALSAMNASGPDGLVQLIVLSIILCIVIDVLFLCGLVKVSSNLSLTTVVWIQFKLFFSFQNATKLLYPWVPVQAIKLILFAILYLARPTNPEAESRNPLPIILFAVFNIG